MHEDQRSASQEMRRLAELHKGDTFGVYELVSTVRQDKPEPAAGIDESAAKPDCGMTRTYRNITSRNGNESAIKGKVFMLREECANDYYKDRLPKIPAGTTIVADFAGDFGMYGMAEIDGALHKVKVDLHELHKINFGEFDARAA